MSAEQIRNDGQTYRLHIIESINDALDNLEAEGYIKILNYYDKEAIYIRKNKVAE